MTYKPNSVTTVIYLAVSLPIRSSDSKGRRTTLILMSCTERGLHCPKRYRFGGELLPRLFTFALRPLFSVALSLESPPPVVSRRPVLRCSDFPRYYTQPSGHLKAIIPLILSGCKRITVVNYYKPVRGNGKRATLG